jgi:RimJ/RimL family protein N-acetyltransferase
MREIMYTPQDFDNEIQKKFIQFKSETDYKKLVTIPVEYQPGRIGRLILLNSGYIKEFSKKFDIIQLLTDWREAEQIWYPSIFPLSYERTKNWFDLHVEKNPNRILFMIEDEKGTPFGHMGLFRGEIDNCLRGDKNLTKGGMTKGLKSLLNWSNQAMGIKKLHLRVFSDNARAINLYTNCGFIEIDKIPLTLIVKGEERVWTEIDNKESNIRPERWFSLMCKELE